MYLTSYVFSVILAAMISAVVLSIVKSKSACGFIIKLLAGLFVALTVISPWKKFNISDISFYLNDWTFDSASNTYLGTETYNEAVRSSIISKTQAYILEKASSMDASLTVEVTVSDDNPPVPVAVELCGDISPYNKTQMKQFLINDLGIPEDAQKWR